MKEIDCYLCPECGAEVLVGSSGCQACGPRKIAKRMSQKKKKAARKKRSWETDGDETGLGLPDDDFDYEDYVAREFGGKPHRQVGLAWCWWVTGVVLLAALVFGLVRAVL